MDNELLREVLESVMQLPCMKWCEDQMRAKADEEVAASAEFADAEMQQETKEEVMAAQEGVPQEGGEVPGEEPEVAGAEGEPEGSPEGEEPKEDKKEFSEEECSKDKMKYEDQAEETNNIGESKLRMEYDQTKRQYGKLEKEYKTLFAKVAEIERKERVATRKNELLQLEAEGFFFDLAEELENIQDMEPAKFSKYLSNVRKNYKKAPIGGLPQSLKPIIPDGMDSRTPRQVMEEASKKAYELYSTPSKRGV